MNINQIANAIRIVEGFPTKGVSFKDITPIMKNPELFKGTIEIMAETVSRIGADYVAGVDARGFFLAPPIAYLLGIGFIPIRKKGKLPYNCYDCTYNLEYGQSTLSIHIDAVEKGKKVVIVDDVLATGGTLNACVNLVRQCGGIIETCFCLMELNEFSGRNNVDADVISLISI